MDSRPLRRSATLLAVAALSRILLSGSAAAEPEAHARLARAAADVEPQVIAWRRDLHQHPELSNRETRTARLVARHLQALRFDEVRTGIAHTGVVGLLRGARPGPTVALRADMDALPVVEQTGLPFASTVRAEYNGREVGVMHACGHDAHTAILLGVATVLAGLREELPGTVEFIFQPAEEGAPEGETGGARLMVEQGVLDELARPEAVFGLHVRPGPPGALAYRSGPLLAAADWLRIVVRGRQTHGSSPWLGIDPILVAARIMTALQTIPSRQLDITKAPAVVTIGSIHGGVRGNIIPDDVELIGTIRTLDPVMREDFLDRIRRTATLVAESAGARAEVEIRPYGPVTANDPELTRRMLPTLEWAAGAAGIREVAPIMGAEDFAFFQQKVPGLYVFLGVNRPGVSIDDAAPNHSPLFYVNEAALVVGVRALSGLAWDYLAGASED